MPPGLAVQDQSGVVQLAGVLQLGTVHVSAAQLLALNSDPAVLLPAPGSDRFYIVFGGYAYYRFGSQAYTAADVLSILTTGDSQPLGTINTAFLESADDAVAQIQGNGSSVANTPASLVVDTAVTLTSNSDPTDGDGTVTIALLYALASTP